MYGMYRIILLSTSFYLFLVRLMTTLYRRFGFVNQEDALATVKTLPDGSMDLLHEKRCAETRPMLTKFAHVRLNVRQRLDGQQINAAILDTLHYYVLHPGAMQPWLN
uniref:Uncharacterized protein n=1 Tax=Globodera rostochiensis TaxID=31243 RepID=A0A914I2F8_GLORO